MATVAEIAVNLKSIRDSLNSYLIKVSNYISNPVGNPLPDTLAILWAINIDNIITHASTNSLSSNSLDHGVLVDKVDKVFAINRELSLRGMTKADFYTHAAGELVLESESNTSDEGYSLNTTQGRNDVI